MNRNDPDTAAPVASLRDNGGRFCNNGPTDNATDLSDAVDLVVDV
jgi:hypothetical protein